MQAVHGTLSLRYQQYTWKCRIPCNLMQGHWTAFDKDYYDRYPSDFCQQVQLKPNTPWDVISSIEILGVEDVRFDEGGI